uniref:Uncharacterized protein n=1 Tax=Gopherus agassizii TaxID=38772 RepID=A0A452IXJ3_9SAUR
LCILLVFCVFLWSKPGFIKCPAALPQNNTVTWSLAALKPGACLSDFEMYVWLGIFFQKSQVSSALKTCSGRYSLLALSVGA